MSAATVTGMLATALILCVPLSAVAETADVHHIHVHRYGDHVEVTMHAYMPDDYSLKQVHDLVDRAEDALRRGLSVEPTIHVDPATER